MLCVCVDEAVRTSDWFDSSLPAWPVGFDMPPREHEGDKGTLRSQRRRWTPRRYLGGDCGEPVVTCEQAAEGQPGERAIRPRAGQSRSVP